MGSPSRSRDKSRHKKKHKRHRHSSDSSDSDSSGDRRKHKSKHKRKSRSRSRSPERRLTWAEREELKEHEKETRRKEKEVLKAMETPEEKRARRLAKKEQKERKRKEKMGWDEEYMGYTNADNPFGDEHLLETFVWSKKLEREGKKNVPINEIQKMQNAKLIENKIELEKVKKRRLEREREREERELEREQEQREKEAEYYSAWEKQEDTFHLEQAKLRSKIRIADSRAKPIDLLAKYINAEDDDVAAVEMHEPYTYLNGLTIQDLEDLLEDIRVYIDMEQGKNADYWRDITTVTEDELAQLRKIDPNTRDFIGERRTGIHTAVSQDVEKVFKGKTLHQLHLLEESIQKKLRGGEGVDVGYWEHLLSQLRAHSARTRLKERHKDQLQRKLFKLKQEQGIGSDPLFPILKEERGGGSRSGSRGGSARASPAAAARLSPAPKPATPQPGPSVEVKEEPQPGPSGEQEIQVKEEEQEDETMEAEPDDEDDDEALITEDDLQLQFYDEYDAGGYSPRLLKASELEPDQIVYDPEDDMKRLEYARNHVMKTGQTEDSEGDFVKRAKEGMDDDEATFSVEVPLEKTNMLWSDKYRPRKPRFFNRVHTGFEWNKYNQTHYDIDNPPPKIVQGYKFNIFYPDLIDKTQTPQYTLTPIESEPDFATLRFRAGPPYEDIAFKVVNREWEYSYKRGFRCQFHNNIFQLWYHFKRYRYRR